jgi:hypothetical protein
MQTTNNMHTQTTNGTRKQHMQMTNNKQQTTNGTRNRQTEHAMACQPDGTLRYSASDMYLWVRSDASYLSKPQAKSCISGYFFLSDHPADPIKAPTTESPQPTPNGAVLTHTKVLKEVISSAAEAETDISSITTKKLQRSTMFTIKIILHHLLCCCPLSRS